MDKVPMHLRIYLMRIKRHSNEDGYFDERFADMGMEKMLIEVQELNELYRLGLIALPEGRKKKTFNPLSYSPRPGVTVHRAGTQHDVPYPSSFAISPSGKYLWMETVFNLAGSAAGAISVAVIGGFVGGWAQRLLA